MHQYTFKILSARVQVVATSAFRSGQPRDRPESKPVRHIRATVFDYHKGFKGVLRERWTILVILKSWKPMCPEIHAATVHALIIYREW